MQFRVQLGLILALLVAGALSRITDADLPPCSLGCFDPHPPQNELSIACRYKQESNFEDTFSPCFYDSCTVKEALTALNITSIICKIPDRDISLGIRIYIVATLVFSSAIIGARVFLKYKSLAGEIGWDDWTIVLAVFFTLEAAVGQFLAATWGLGRDAWKIPFEDQEKIFKSFYASAVGYKIGNMFVRMSILCFYLRIFSNTGGFRIAVYMAIAANIAIGIAFTFADAFQCKPISYFWDGWDGEHQGECLHISTIAWAHSVLNIMLDVVTLIMALWMVKKLNMKVQKKFSVIGMFVLGSAITLVTFLRLQAIPPLANARNRTWGIGPLAYWSGIEMASGLICACLPALKKLRYLWKGPEKSTYNSNSSGYRSNGSYAINSRSTGVSRRHVHREPEILVDDFELDTKQSAGGHASTSDLVHTTSKSNV